MTARGSRWQAHWETATGTYFYHNAETGETTYDRPQGILTAITPVDEGAYAQGQGEIDPNSGWAKYYDVEYQAEYYHNHSTSETQYERPATYETPRSGAVTGALAIAAD
ncbi:unnamed protein product, partial [Sphacelaria rigidula]